MIEKRVTPEGCLGLFRRQVYLDVALRGKEVTCYETVEGLEVRRSQHRLYLLREYRRWQNRYWRADFPAGLWFLSYTSPPSPRSVLSQIEWPQIQSFGIKSVSH